MTPSDVSLLTDRNWNQNVSRCATSHSGNNPEASRSREADGDGGGAVKGEGGRRRREGEREMGKRGPFSFRLNMDKLHYFLQVSV